MNILIKFSGEFFTAQDELTPEGKSWLQNLMKFKRGYIVTGGGNRIRGRNSEYSRNAADNLGVLSTLMNAFILQENMRRANLKVKIFSHFFQFGEYYDPELAKSAFEEHNWIIFGSGLGKVGYVSTDLNSVIKALEVGAKAIIKISNACGVWDKDPKLAGAKLISNISHDEVIARKLHVLDFSALEIAAENKLPIAIIGIQDFSAFISGENVGSIIGTDWR